MASAARIASTSTSPPSSISFSSSAVSTALSLAATCPDWEECASSAITANVLPLRPLFARISAIANGNVWIVTTMISFPSVSAFASSPDFDPPRARGLVAVDRDDDALVVVDLLDRVLQLRVEHVAVGDDDDRVEHLLVVDLQARHPVRGPGDRVGLSRAGGVLDQIAVADAFAGDRGRDVRDGLPLVESREPQRR